MKKLIYYSLLAIIFILFFSGSIKFEKPVKVEKYKLVYQDEFCSVFHSSNVDTYETEIIKKQGEKVSISLCKEWKQLLKYYNYE